MPFSLVFSIQCALDILEAKDTKSFSSVPFASLLANSLIWTYYGALKNDMSLIIPNGIGIVSGVFCLLVFNTFSKSTNTITNTVLMGLCGLATALLLHKQAGLLGSLGCILAVVLLAAPLSTLGTVMREKSTNALPFPVSFGLSPTYLLHLPLYKAEV